MEDLDSPIIDKRGTAAIEEMDRVLEIIHDAMIDLGQEGELFMELRKVRGRLARERVLLILDMKREWEKS